MFGGTEFNGVLKILKICTNSKMIFQSLSVKNSDKTSFYPKNNFIDSRQLIEKFQSLLCADFLP